MVRRFCPDDRLTDILSFRVSSDQRNALERIADDEKISIAEAARQAMNEGLRTKVKAC